MENLETDWDDSPPPVEIGYPCRITARFEHDGPFDDIALNLGIQRDPDLARRAGGPVLRGCPADARMFLSSPFCPFRDYIEFLEDVVYNGGTEGCDFEWDAEGPMGRLRWYPSADASIGTLSLRWTVRRSAGLRRYLVLDRRQMVEALYRGFRSFVEGPDYVGLRYEEASVYRQFEVALGADAVEPALELLVRSSSDAVRAALVRINDATRPPDGGRPARLSVEGLTAALPPALELAVRDICFGLTDLEWDRGSQSVRWRAIHKALEWRAGDGFGLNLGALRSPVIEHWLKTGDPRLPFDYRHRERVEP